MEIPLFLYWNHEEEKVPGSFFSAQIFKDFAGIMDEWATTDPAQLKLFWGEIFGITIAWTIDNVLFRNRYKLEGIYLLDEP